MDKIRKLIAEADEALGKALEALEDTLDNDEFSSSADDEICLAINDMQFAISEYQQRKGWI